jgi:DNA-binding transcriptional LysR family regulator
MDGGDIMDIRVLKYFLAVAQEESITRAAAILHTSQPNVSRQLHDLEVEVGKKLFERGSRKITLTEEGMFLQKRAQEIVELMERTEADLNLFDDETSGDVHIGAAETHAMRLVAHAMQSLRETHPKILYHIFSGSTVEVVEQLNKGLLDFGILVDPVDPQKFDHHQLPVHDTWGVLMRRDSPLAKLTSIRPEDIRDKPLLCAQQMLDADDISNWLGEDFQNLNVVITFNLITTPAMMVEEGLGYTFTFDQLVNTTGDCNLCFRPLEPKFETGLYLVWKKHQVFSRAARAFLEQIRSQITPLATDLMD